jgi:hypothetical protein
VLVHVLERGNTQHALLLMLSWPLERCLLLLVQVVQVAAAQQGWLQRP